MAVQNEQSSPCPSCLFTGVPISEQNAPEHTIPRSLAGRIASRRVSSTTFNKVCGDRIDKDLAALYELIFNRLGPLTHWDHRAANLNASVAGDPGRFRFAEGGLIKRVGVKVEKRDPSTGRPISASASDPDALREFIRKAGHDPENWSVSPTAVSGSDIVTYEGRSFGCGSELSALKSILLTFDHLLSHESARFTRSQELAATREFVRASVISRRIRRSDYVRIVRGLQYEKLSHIRGIREALDVEATPFEHFMLVVANAPTRTLDAVWWVAGIDPFGFRLSDRWQGRSFGIAVVSGVLQNTRTQVREFPFDFVCGDYPQWRFMPDPSPSAAQAQAFLRIIGEFHREAWQKATDLFERNCQEVVCAHISREARLLAGQGRGGLVVDALAERMRTLFAWRMRDPKLAQVFQACVNQVLRNIDPGIRADRVAADGMEPRPINWVRWFLVHLALLDALRPDLGMPGEISSPDPIVELKSNKTSQPF